jgi:dihydropteroate synthase
MSDASAPEQAARATHVQLGAHGYDIRTRALVMAILNRTPDSFYDRGATWSWDAFWSRAETVVAEGADLLDVGAVKAGPGPHVDEQEEMDRLLPAVEGLVARFDVPVSVDTWRASVARHAFALGAVVGNDISGFADPAYLSTAAAANATVVATHIRLAPRVADPDPVYHDLVGEVRGFLLERAARARQAGIPSERVVLDAGLDLGKTALQSAQLLRASSELADLGYPLLLSASNKTFLGKLFDLEVDQRHEATAAAHALGVSLGCRLLRAHDVRSARRVRDMLEAILEASADRPVQVGGHGHAEGPAKP